MPQQPLRPHHTTHDNKRRYGAVLASVPTSTAARLIDSGRKPWKVPNYWPYAVSLSGQGQVVSGTLIADVGNVCLGSAGRTRAIRSQWFSGRRRSSGMSIDSGAEALPRKNRRGAKRNVEGDIRPGLRKHITQAAKEIRSEEHTSEL